jgi:hypothetical protein
MQVEAWFKRKPVCTTSYRHPAFAKVGKGNGLLYLERNQPKAVMRGLDPRIHAVTGASGPLLHAWMAGSNPAMTTSSSKDEAVRQIRSEG